MKLSVSPIGIAAYILRRGSSGSSRDRDRDRDRDISCGPEDLLRVGVFRSMVAALIRGEAGSREELESCTAIFRMDIAVLNRSSQTQRVCNTTPHDYHYIMPLHYQTSSNISLYLFLYQLRVFTIHMTAAHGSKVSR